VSSLALALIPPYASVDFDGFVGRLMHSLKWSPQKPETRAVERDEEAIERWKRKDWPRERCWLAGSSKTLPPHANLALARFTKN